MCRCQTGMGGIYWGQFSRAIRDNPAPQKDNKYVYPESLRMRRNSAIMERNRERLSRMRRGNQSLFFWALKRIFALYVFLCFVTSTSMVATKLFIVWFGEYI